MHVNRMILKLSGGKQQRISIVKVSHMILADELTGSLDRKTENEILKIFKKLAKEEKNCYYCNEFSKCMWKCRCDLRTWFE